MKYFIEGFVTLAPIIIFLACGFICWLLWITNETLATIVLSTVAFILICCIIGYIKSINEENKHES